MKFLQSTLAVLFLASLPVAPQASPIVPLPISQLIDASELVIHGTVTGKSVQKDDEGRIYTKIDLDIIDVWKGDASGSPFTIVHSGGILGDRWSTASGEVSYQLGEEVVAFLIVNSRGEGVTTAMNQGKFLVEQDPDTEQKYTRNPFHGGRVSKAGQPKGYRLPTKLPLTVENLKRQVTSRRNP